MTTMLCVILTHKEINGAISATPLIVRTRWPSSQLWLQPKTHALSYYYSLKHIYTHY